MSDEKTAGLFTFTHPVLIAHPHLFDPKRAKNRAGKETGEPKFSVNLVVPADHPELEAFKKHLVKTARGKWVDRPMSELKLPISSGDKLADKRKEKSGKDDGDYQRGKAVIVSRSKYAPQLSAHVDGRLIEFTDETKGNAKKYFYFGVEACVQVNCVAYDAVDDDGKPGVTAYLQSVMSTNKGKKIAGGGQSAAETFKGYVGKTTGEDPTAGADSLVDDDIAF